MKISIKDFFKTGDLWSNLDKTISLIKKHLTIQSEHIKDLKHRDILILQYIKKIEEENKDLKIKIEKIDERLWKINTMYSSKNLVDSHNQKSNKLLNIDS